MILGMIAVAAPRRHDGNVRIRHQFMVAAIIQKQNHRNRLLRIARAEHNPCDARPALVRLEPHLILTTDGEARQRTDLFINQFRYKSFWLRRFLSIHFFRKDFQNLRAAFRPFRRALQLRAVRKRQRILQRIRRDFRFVIIRLVIIRTDAFNSFHGCHILLDCFFQFIGVQTASGQNANRHYSQCIFHFAASNTPCNAFFHRARCSARSSSDIDGLNVLLPSPRFAASPVASIASRTAPNAVLST